MPVFDGMWSIQWSVSVGLRVSNGVLRGTHGPLELCCGDLPVPGRLGRVLGAECPSVDTPPREYWASMSPWLAYLLGPVRSACATTYVAQG